MAQHFKGHVYWCERLCPRSVQIASFGCLGTMKTTNHVNPKEPIYLTNKQGGISVLLYFLGLLDTSVYFFVLLRTSILRCTSEVQKYAYSPLRIKLSAVPKEAIFFIRDRTTSVFSPLIQVLASSLLHSLSISLQTNSRSGSNFNH